MKCTLVELDGCFAIELTPETIDETARLVRFGMNATKELRHSSVCVRRDLTILGNIVIGKKKRSSSTINKK